MYMDMFVDMSMFMYASHILFTAGLRLRPGVQAQFYVC